MKATHPLNEVPDVNNGAARDGIVQVNNCRIIITDPSDGGRPARISPGRGIKLFIDNVEVKEPAEVFQDSKIRAEIEKQEPVRRFNINLLDNNLAVSVSVAYEDGIDYVLNDRPDSNNMVLDVKPAARITCPRYTLDEAKNLLKEKGIIYGIDEGKLSGAVENGSNCAVVVAEGVNPEEGTDDVIEKRYDEADKELVEVNGRVDFYSIGKITSVNPGQLTAEKINGRDGKTGIDIFGHPIPPKKRKKVALSAGRGVKVSGDGMKAYSEIMGRPEIKEGVISVYEVFETSADVDVTTGNIDFVGDVIIKGNINDGMKVKSGGNVLLLGSITGGEIEAAGDVTVYKNVIGSRIKGGCGDFIRYNIIDVMANIKDCIGAILSAAVKLKETGKVPDMYKDGQIIKLLIDTKYGSISGHLADIKNLLSKNMDYIDKDTIQAGAGLIKYFSGNGPILIENISELNVFIERIDGRIDVLTRQLKQPSNITAPYVQNSVLSTSGSIKITGKGCYNSDLSCRGDVVFERYGSVMRGGNIDARGSVSVYELGSAGGALTTVGAGKESQITCETAHMNAVIRVGEMSLKIGESVKKLKAYIHMGELMVEKSKI